LPWFVTENRRAAPRHRYDGNDTWVRLGGSLVRQCQIVDLSRTGVRLAVTNAETLPNTFALILSKNSSGRPARMKWRCGNEVGAEFFTANSSLALRSTAEAPSAVKPRRSEGQKSENRLSTLTLHAQVQHPIVAKLKTDDRAVVGSIGGDKAKTGSISGDKAKTGTINGDKPETKVHCQITDIGEQLDRADQEKDSKKRMDLSRLQKKLGPTHLALIHALGDVDPESPHGQELASIIDSLDE
jgi:hypothetical protein